jgi:hypothetical protein
MEKVAPLQALKSAYSRGFLSFSFQAFSEKNHPSLANH